MVNFLNSLLSKKGLKLSEKLNREVAIRPDDLFLVSYPKSGNTWLRFLFVNILSHKPASFPDANSKVPDIHNSRSLGVMESLTSPRVLKSHFAFEPLYPRVIYLVRDPRSVCVSQFFFKKRRGEIARDTEFNEYFDEFLKGFSDGYGSWGEHVGSWLGAKRNAQDFLLVRYEDMKEDIEREMKRMLTFARLEVDGSRLKSAIENSDLKAMKKTEQESNHGAHLKGKGDLSIPFVRKGSTNEWKEYLSEDMQRLLLERFSYGAEACGYEFES